MDQTTKEERLIAVNKMIDVIGSVGRNFFNHRGTISWMEVDARGRVWFIDSYTNQRVYTHNPRGRWRGFSNGGTLRSLVCHFRDFIVKSTPVPRHCFGPWPEYLCSGDLWGYGDSMAVVRKAALTLGIL
jgi:hypothetical protein